MAERAERRSVPLTLDYGIIRQTVGEYPTRVYAHADEYLQAGR